MFILNQGVHSVTHTQGRAEDGFGPVGRVLLQGLPPPWEMGISQSVKVTKELGCEKRDT